MKVEVPMNDRPEPSAEPPVVDVNVVALRRPDPPAAEVDVGALKRAAPAPTPEVDARALTRPVPAPPAPPAGRGRRVFVGTALAVLVLMAGAGVWWHRQVTADPRLEFS